MRAETWKAKGNAHIDLELSATMPYHQAVSDLVLKYANAGDSLIDLGCGLGHVVDEVNQGNEHLVFDIADAYDACLDATSKRVKIDKQFKINELTFNVKDIVDKKYDVAVMSHVLEHLIFPAKALDDVFSMMKPNGVIILAVPNPVRPAIFITNLFKRHYVNRGHVHAWDCSHWRNFLENIMGYEVLEYRTDFIQLPFSTRSSLSRGIGKFLVKFAPWWGYSNIAVVRKKPQSNSVFDNWLANTEG